MASLSGDAVLVYKKQAGVTLSKREKKTGRFPLAASCHVQLRRPAVAAGSSGREQRKQQEPPAKDRADEISKGEVEEDGGARPLRGLLIPSYLLYSTPVLLGWLIKRT